MNLTEKEKELLMLGLGAWALILHERKQDTKEKKQEIKALIQKIRKGGKGEV
jgi:hypothetical protein